MTLRTDRGFTLIELLMVIVIIGVIGLMIGPTFSTGSDIGRVKTASRGVMQLSRYARTMALLHQTPVDLVFTSGGGLSVADAGGGGESLVSSRAFASTNSAAESAEASDSGAAGASGGAGTDAQEGGGSSYAMAELALAKTYDRVAFVFEGYTDSMDDGRRSPSDLMTEEEGAEGDVQTFRIRYKSNGTCRPYRVKVSADGDAAYAVTVTIDVLGSAKIEDEDE